MGYHERSSSPVYSSSFSCPRPELNPLCIDSELWLMAEHRIFEILCSVQPALASEQKRHDVISYIMRLIKAHYSTEVFAVGSVPLKTYLPDGDIDLTILSHQDVEEELAKGVLEILQGHEHDSRFEIKNIQYIEAKVKILKLLVNNISVDISFNQMEGLSALCFLEQIDQIVGKNHLLKRSIILIKSWCYYESRTLGAFHGLFSTYALEILILHLFNLFHSSLEGPLAVLYKFLDYYSSFDWDKYVISIDGVISISSLPNIVAERPAQAGSLLLMPDFLRYCKETYAVPVKALDRGMQQFTVKSINIVDPLKENNNLGRSVHRGNFYRINFALSYGAQKLREVLTGPGERVGRGLENFFSNTLERNGMGERPDADVPVPPFGTGRYEGIDLDSDHVRWCHSGLLQGQLYHRYKLPDYFHQLPLLPPRALSRSSGDALPGSLQNMQNIFQHRVTKAFLQRGQPMLFPCPAPRCSTPFERPRGTGTFIPDKAFYQEISKARNQLFKPQYRPSVVTNQVEARGSSNPAVKTPSDSSSPTSELTPSVAGNQVESSVTPTDEETTELEKVDIPGERVAREGAGAVKKEECQLKSEDFPPLTKLGLSKLKSFVTPTDEKATELEKVDIPGERVAREGAKGAGRKGECQFKSDDFPPLTKLSLSKTKP
ncbi:hypothetical protein LINPERPRIM_LOCUS23529 [Linum perenne]